MNDSEETLSIWDLNRRKRIVRLKAGTVLAVAVSADGRRLITADTTHIALWSLNPILDWDRCQDGIKRLRALPFSIDGIATSPAGLESTPALFKELVARNLNDTEFIQYHLGQDECRATDTLPSPRATPTPSETHAAIDVLIAKARTAKAAVERADWSEQVLALDSMNDEAARIWLAAVPAVSPVDGPTEPIPLQIIITGTEASGNDTLPK
jgi:hypothetical protein